MIGKAIVELPCVDSTNNYANQLSAGAEVDNGTVIWAHDQYSGRGQGDHQWQSEKGRNLTFTVCLQPFFLEPDRQFQLNKVITLGVIDFFRSFSESLADTSLPEFHIKWPNDIYAGMDKIGGILIENKIMGAAIVNSFVGIGLNINQMQFSEDLPNPVSLIHILGHETVLKDALLSCCQYLNRRYLQFLKDGGTSIDHEYDRNLLGFECWRSFLYQSCHEEGKITGVDHSGRLKVKLRNGESICCNHGEIAYIL